MVMDQNLSGAFDYERQRFEEEQELLRADPAYREWLAFVDSYGAMAPEQEKDYGDHGNGHGAR